MFCKYCGKEIADESKFCSSCGKALEVSVMTELHPKNHEIWGKLQGNKKLSYTYGLWLTLNLALLLFGNNNIFLTPTDYFYPEVGLSEISIYDIKEFIFYAFLLPFAFWLVCKLHKCYKMKNHK